MKRRPNQARWYPSGQAKDSMTTMAAGVTFLAEPARSGWLLTFRNEDTGDRDVVQTFGSFGELRDFVDLNAPQYAWFNQQVRRKTGRARNQPDSGERLRDELMEDAEWCGEGGDEECMQGVLVRAREALERDPGLIADVEGVIESYFPELLQQGGATKKKRSGYFTNPLGTLDQIPKAAAMWEAVYDSSLDRGFSEESSAKQAWGAVKRAGYRKGKGGKWRAPNQATGRFEVGDLVKFSGKFLRSIGMVTSPINGRVEGFSSLETPEGEPFPVVLWSDAEKEVAVHPGNIVLDRGGRRKNAVRVPNVAISEWVVFEVESCMEHEAPGSAGEWDFTDELKADQERFTAEANRVVRGWIAAHPDRSKSLVASDDLDSDDDVAWNTWAYFEGHGVGFWEHMSREDYQELVRAMSSDVPLRQAESILEASIQEICAGAGEEGDDEVLPKRTGYFTNPPTGDGPSSNTAPADISGPLRFEQKADGLWVVGLGVAVPVESKREGKEVMARLRRRPNPYEVTVVEFGSEDELADGLAIMDVALRSTRHRDPVVFRLDWEDRAIVLDAPMDDPGVGRALGALDRCGVPFRASGVSAAAANPSSKEGSPARAAGLAFLGQLLGSLLGFGVGALVGGLVGGLVAGEGGAAVGGTLAAGVGMFLGGLGGAMEGASRGAPKKSERGAALGAAVGAAIPFVSLLAAPAGAYLGAEGQF